MTTMPSGQPGQPTSVPTQRDFSGVTVVFDLDGTLVDTAPDLISATNHTLGLHALPPTTGELVRPWISFGARRMIIEAFALAKHPLSEPETDRLMDEFLEFYTANIAHGSRPFPGLIASLDRLTEAGAKLAICTNKREHLSRKLLDALDLTQHFAAIAGRDTFPVFKPDPRHLSGAIDLAGGSPGRAVMIGDSATDIHTAHAASIPVVGVTFGYTDRHVSEFSPTATIDHYDELLPALDAIFSRQ